MFDFSVLFFAKFIKLIQAIVTVWLFANIHLVHSFVHHCLPHISYEYVSFCHVLLYLTHLKFISYLFENYLFCFTIAIFQFIWRYFLLFYLLISGKISFPVICNFTVVYFFFIYFSFTHFRDATTIRNTHSRTRTFVMSCSKTRCCHINCVSTPES